MDAWLVPLGALILAAAALLLSTIGVRRQASTDYVRSLETQVGLLTVRVEKLERDLSAAEAERVEALHQLAEKREENIELMRQLLRTTGGRRQPPSVG